MACFAQKVKVLCSHRRSLGKVLCQQLATHPFKTLTPPRTSFSMRFFSSRTGVVGVVSDHLHTSTPWLTLPPEIDPATGRKVDCFYSVIDKQIVKLDRKKSLKVPEQARCFSSSRGWLSFIDPSDCSLYLSNPFHESPLIRLPSIETLPPVLGVKRNPSSNSIDKFIMVDHEIGIFDDGKRCFCYEDAEKMSKYYVKHVSLSCEPFNCEQDCVAMVGYGDSGYCQPPQLAYCRVGREESWTTLIGGTISYPQTVCPLKSSDNMKRFYPSNGENNHHVQLFYSISQDMLIGNGIDAWEIPKPWKIPARRANFLYEKFYFKTLFKVGENLVVDESSGDILLVHRHTFAHDAKDGTIVDEDPYYVPYKTLRFEVYKVDMKEQKLKRVNFLGDRAIFLGLNQSFTLSASKFPCLRPNSIYFTDDSTSFGGHDMGIYNLKDNSIEPCYPFPDDLEEDMEIRPSPLWVAPSGYC